MSDIEVKYGDEDGEQVEMFKVEKLKCSAPQVSEFSLKICGKIVINFVTPISSTFQAQTLKLSLNFAELKKTPFN